MQLFVKIYNDKNRFLTAIASSYTFLSQVIIFKSSFHPKPLFWWTSVIVNYYELEFYIAHKKQWVSSLFERHNADHLYKGYYS